MTNHWNDIDNTSLVFVYGANPAENHPACMAHINAARFGAKKARMIVVDPRLTRTALQCDPNRKKLGSATVPEPDLYVRIRPGTNVAFTNGLMKWIFDNMAAYDNGTGTVAANMLDWHNGTAANSTNANTTGDLTKPRTFVDDNGATVRPLADQWQGAYYDAATAVHPLATGYPKYTDTRFVVNAAGTDYVRGVLHIPNSTAYPTNLGGPLTSFPVIADSVLSTVTVGPDTCDTVWTSLIKHLAPYDTATVADICGCSATDIVNVAKALIDNCRFKSSDWNAAQATPQATTYKATTVLYAMGQTQHTNGSQNIKDLAIIQTLMGNMGRPGGGINALRGIHNVQGSTDWGLLYDNIPGYSGNPAATDSYEHYLDTLFGNRMTNSIKTASLAVGAGNSLVTFTAVTAGAFGNLVTIQFDGTIADAMLSVAVTGNDIKVTLATTGAAITSNAADVAAKVATTPAAAALVSAVAGGTGLGAVASYAQTHLAGGYDVNTYHLDASKLGLQQRGFANMTTEWFGKGTSVGADIEKLYNAWPKGNGVQHIQTFRNMALPVGDANRIISSIIWGQNPAVTEPNQSKVRAGLAALDLMVVVDMFETETAACDRNPNGVTYLIPSCAHVEEAGSVTNSGRWLQWRERATAPKGNSKADLELLFRLAYSLDKAGAFSHLTNRPYTDDGTGDVTTEPTDGVWSTLGTKIKGGAYNVLYAAKYGWTPGGAAFEAITDTTERWAPGLSTPDLAYTGTGSEIYAERVYEEFARPLNQLANGTASSLTGGTMWIYSGSPAAASATAGSTLGVGGYNGSTDWNINNIPALTVAVGTATWQVKNRAKSRNSVVKGNDLNGANNYPRWGWAWLYNRRVFYNNGEISGDQSDTFVSPGLVSLLFTESAAPGAGLADWSLVYRKYKTFADAPSVTSGPHFPTSLSPGGTKTLMGRFPGHTEPYESPAVTGNPAFAHDYVALFGHNMSGSSRLIVEGADGSAIGAYGTTSTTYPLVLTSIRCVEHFQGGPVTRNNSWNVEAEPVPWVEINSIDARTYGITDGQWVNVITARSNSTSDQVAETPDSPDTTWARGFKARVGVGLQSNQRVAPGVVAIPWHWGDKGLSTGSRANDLCIDAWDANSQIPEYKACLCQIVGL